MLHKLRFMDRMGYREGGNAEQYKLSRSIYFHQRLQEFSAVQVPSFEACVAVVVRYGAIFTVKHKVSTVIA